MKKTNGKIKVIFIYFSIIIFCIIVTNLNYSKLYNKVTIINDKDEVVKKINMSIPVKIKISNNIWGSYILEDNNSIKQIWNLMNKITNDSLKEKNQVNKITEGSINGTIYYLNGMKDDFEIKDSLKLNKYIYNDSYKVPIINTLKNTLFGYLYTPKNIGNFINARNKVTISNNDKEALKLGNVDKETIKNIIYKSYKIENDKEIVDLTTKSENPTAHIKVYIDQENDDFLKSKSYNVVNIDVYDHNFFVVQYMGDENGRHIYIRGNLNDICRKIN
ncbi:DUF3919 family protein [Clostridium oceanicum]|uniref:DUF3919 family protein n=1 Tax=Clostridium oceanicum TaxID=1543 RepID=A0ABN1JI03_9CLOT